MARERLNEAEIEAAVERMVRDVWNMNPEEQDRTEPGEVVKRRLDELVRDVIDMYYAQLQRERDARRAEAKVSIVKAKGPPPGSRGAALDVGAVIASWKQKPRSTSAQKAEAAVSSKVGAAQKAERPLSCLD